MAKKLRVNEGIRVPTVRLIDEEGVQLGIMAIEKARDLARERELDLVEAAPNANPPVCKIMDYGKYLYKLKKQEAKQRKASKAKEMKGIRLSIRTDKHDLEVKSERAKKFLGEGHPIKIQMIFKGREITHIDFGKEKMAEFVDSLREVGKIEQEAKRQGFQLFAIIIPK